jgi:vancomycin resistance protein VanW
MDVVLWLVSLWLALFPGTPVPHLLQGTAPSAAIVQPAAGGPPVTLPYKWASVTTNYYHASATQAVNIEITANRVNGTVLNPGQVFSYYAKVGPYTAENGYGWGRAFQGDRIVPSVGGGVCQGASTLYAAVLRTGLRVIERHQHGLKVPYLPPGEDATVSGHYLNFQFQNNTEHPVLIQASARDRHYHVTIWGAVPGPDIQVKHQLLATYPYQTIRRTDDKLKPGEEKVLAPGQEGAKARTWLEIHQDGKVLKQDKGVDIYRASPRIVLVGPGTAAPTVTMVSGPPLPGGCYP